MVQGVGFEPTKLYAPELKSGPFDHSGTPASPLSTSLDLNRADLRPLFGGVKKTMQRAIELYERFNTPPITGR